MIKYIDLIKGNNYLIPLSYSLGILFIITALFMILTESAVHSILYLMFIFLYLAELTIILKMEFLALIFLIIYIGAVCVLMLFHIKLIKTFVHRFDNMYNKELFLPIIFVSLILPMIQIFTLICENLNHEIIFFSINNLNYIFSYTQWIDLIETLTSLQLLGYLLYNIYFIQLIITAVILLISMIGSIFITQQLLKKKKTQLIEDQLNKDINIKLKS